MRWCVGRNTLDGCIEHIVQGGNVTGHVLQGCVEHVNEHRGCVGTWCKRVKVHVADMHDTCKSVSGVMHVAWMHDSRVVVSYYQVRSELPVGEKRVK